LTSGKWQAVARFRVRQHIEPLQRLGVSVREYIPAIDKYAQPPGRTWRGRHEYGNPYYVLWQGLKLATRLPGLAGSWKGQITWLERNLMDGAPTLEPLLKGPLVLDVDDAIWLMLPWGQAAAARVARRSAVVLAGNQYLADWFSQYARDIQVVPTAVDTERFHPLDPGQAERDRPFIVGWTGSASNLVYLEQLEKALRIFMDRFSDVQLVVVSDVAPRLPNLAPGRVRHVAWSPATETEAVRRMHVGLMPLPDNAWTRGKCAFKMLQYMASGIPSVVSPVGMNSRILAMDRVGLGAVGVGEWVDALVHFYRNRSEAVACGARGRTLAVKYFSRPVVSEQLAAIFRELV
jgi:glycosyltransferase involved in cell wall biosynthesis